MADITFEDLRNSTFKDNQSTTNAQSYNTEQKAVEDTYKSATASAERIASSKFSDADILSQKLAKYIPNYLASQGVNGGLSETYALKANSGLQNLYANINNTLESTKQSALETYNTNKVTAKANDETLAYTDYQNELNVLSSKTDATANDYSEVWSRYKDVLGNNSQTAWNELQSAISDKTDEEDVDTSNNKISFNKGSYSDDLKYSDVLSMSDYTDANNFTAVINKYYAGSSLTNNQAQLSRAVYNDIKSGKIKDGDAVILNYGAKAENTAFIYQNGNLYRINKGLVSEKLLQQAYIPEGYILNSTNNLVRTDSTDAITMFGEQVETGIQSGALTYVKDTNQKRVKSSDGKYEWVNKAGVWWRTKVSN